MGTNKIRLKAVIALLAVSIIISGCGGSSGLGGNSAIGGAGGSVIGGLPALQPTHMSVPARVSFKVKDKTFTKQADSTGYFYIPVDVEAPSKVEITATHEKESVTDEAWVLEKKDPEPSKNKANWTLLIYLDGNSNLEEYCRVNLEDMEEAGSPEKVNAIVEFGRSTDRGRAVVLRIRKDEQVPDTIKDGVVFGRVIRTDKGLSIVQCPKSSIILKTIEKADMASKDNLADFIAMGEKNFPAEHYLLDISTHGGGYKNIRTNYQYVLYDSESSNVMTLDELKDVLEKAPVKFDILGFDACLMAMAEVMYDFKDSLNPASGYFIGSPEATSAYGWPYGNILKSLGGEPSKTPEELAKEIVNLDAEYYKAKGITEELLCAIKLSKLDGIAKEFSDLSGELAKVSEDPAALTELKNIRASVLVYNDPSFVDLVDLCDMLAKSELKGNIKEKASGVIAAVKEAVIDKGFTEGRVTRSGGISIFFPADKGKSDSWKDLKGNSYSNLAFVKSAPRWQAFLENFNASLIPYLTDVKPDSGKAGIKVEARGFFGKEKGEVYIGEAEAPVVSWKADKLEIKVPNGAKSGNLQVKVKERKSNGIKFEVF